MRVGTESEVAKAAEKLTGEVEDKEEVEKTTEKNRKKIQREERQGREARRG